MGSDSIPLKKMFLHDSINRGLGCAHMHSTARTQKIATFMSWTGECWLQKHTPSMHHPRRRNVSTSMVGSKNGHICKHLTKNSEAQRYSRGVVT